MAMNFIYVVILPNCEDDNVLFFHTPDFSRGGGRERKRGRKRQREREREGGEGETIREREKEK